MRFWLTLSFVGLYVWVSPIAHADIYTWTDAAGRVNVSNITPPEGARVTRVRRDISPKPDAPASRDNAQQPDVRALADRVRQLEQELDVAKSAPAPTPVPTPLAPPVVAIWNYVAPPVSPVADAGLYAQSSYGACDFNCGPAWASTMYPAGVAVVSAPALRRPHPLRPAPRRPSSIPQLPYVAMGRLPLTFVH